MTRELRQRTQRVKGPGLQHLPALLEREWMLLARIAAGQFLEQRAIDERDHETADSLERFGLLDHAHLYDDDLWVSWSWAVNDDGQALLDARRPRRHGCRCKDAIRLNCVCEERTWCPNPDHTGNGCHGKHD